MKLTRRHTLVAAAAATALALTGCAADTAKDAQQSNAAASGPITIEHIYGETTFDQVPEDIATISWVNADALLALDTVPVGMDSDIWGQNANNSTDWKDAKLKELGAQIGSENAPTQFSVADGIDFEAIAQAKPQAIFAAYSGLTKEEYDKLSKIAPTVGPIEANYLTSWQQTTEAAGELLGKDEQAQQLIKDLEGELAGQAEKYPVFKDTSFIAGDLSQPKTISLYAGEDNRPRFLTSLGMKQAEVVAQNTPEGSFYFEWSPEKANELKSDIFFASVASGTTVQDALKSNELFAQIPASKTGGLVAMKNDQQVLSVSAASPLSLSWAIDNVVPKLADAAQKAAEAK
ncbi:ABC transporter substrate-binding protein [Glutamicibacter creatinolyticus]|uniref:ABC transporter substrate-binding protein n=1 Tax=Glutamicibacter creatinolyticus TaxID=162496 RepID=UPI0031E2787C